jgi:hypothetical protein
MGATRCLPDAVDERLQASALASAHRLAAPKPGRPR